MPALTPTAELRSDDPFVTIQSALSTSGLTIPPEARGAYQDLPVDPIPLRLYAATWFLTTTDDSPEWTLLLVLGTVSGESLPFGVGLQVQVAGELLDRQSVETAVPYLYVHVIGNLNEQFWSGIRLPTGEIVELSPFTFNVNDS
ncbi:MAG: hypothetical protein HC866_13210 [Leptolyngbyaceae cyanobacterium RU_5_1]|nr:hypothetical protein [Leptolyngbyaceae cyanobacterium RU_5_1]